MTTAQETYSMLGNQSLWNAAAESHAVLDRAGIPHAIVGGVAVCLHGYQRNTVDVDILARREDSEGIRDAFNDAGYEWRPDDHEYRSPAGIAIQFLLSPDSASDDRSMGIKFPDPNAEDATIEIEGLSVISLTRLIELKIACGLGSNRRMFRDFADVVELIAFHDLSRSHARFLHKAVRKTFRELVLRSRGEA